MASERIEDEISGFEYAAGPGERNRLLGREFQRIAHRGSDGRELARSLVENTDSGDIAGSRCADDERRQRRDAAARGRIHERCAELQVGARCCLGATSYFAGQLRECLLEERIERPARRRPSLMRVKTLRPRTAIQ